MEHAVIQNTKIQISNFRSQIWYSSFWKLNNSLIKSVKIILILEQISLSLDVALWFSAKINWKLKDNIARNWNIYSRVPILAQIHLIFFVCINSWYVSIPNKYYLVKRILLFLFFNSLCNFNNFFWRLSLWFEI